MWSAYDLSEELEELLDASRPETVPVLRFLCDLMGYMDCGGRLVVDDSDPTARDLHHTLAACVLSMSPRSADARQLADYVDALAMEDLLRSLRQENAALRQALEEKC